MLGLGLSVSKTAGLRSLVARLLSKLRSRATYYENGKDSKEFLEVLAGTELLDDATIVLTPTATSDALVHSVKTYTGDELVTNGTFDTDSNWTKGSGATISGGQGNIVGDGSAFVFLQQNDVFTIGNRYRITVDVTINSGLGLKFQDGSTNENFGFATTSGSYTFYGIANNEDFVVGRRTGGTAFDSSVDNISIIDVSSDFDFDRASSATRINSDGLVQDMQSITDPELVLNGDFEDLGDELITNGDFATDSNWSVGTNITISGGKANFLNANKGERLQQNFSFTADKTYKVVITVSNYVSGQLGFYMGGGYVDTGAIDANGTYTYYHTPTNNSEAFFRAMQTSASHTFSIDNVSVQQVDPNDRWTVANSDADNYVEFTEGFARLKFLNTSPITTLSSTLTLQANKTYELVVDVHDVTSGAIKIDAAGLSELFNTEGVTTRYLNPTGNTTLSFYRATADVDITLASVSVKDVTFSEDVDLARINYDSNGDNGHILLEPTSTNIIPYSNEISLSTSQTNSGTGSIINATDNYGISPDGTRNASRVVGTSASGTAEYALRNFILATTLVESYTQSVYLKSNTGSDQKISYYGRDTGVRGFITVTSKWQRFELSGNSNTTNYYVYLGLRPEDGTDTSCDILVYGYQLEQLDHATSLIPTLTGSTVTRAAETLNGSGNSTLINTAEGTLYLESKLSGLTGTKLFSIGGGTNNSDPAIVIGYTNQNMYIDVQDGGSLISTPGDKTITGVDTSLYNKMAIKYTTTNVTVYLNGVKKHTETIDFTPDTNVIKSLYGGYSAGSKFEGGVKAVTVFNRALTDNELEILTSTSYSSFGAVASAGSYEII